MHYIPGMMCCTLEGYALDELNISHAANTCTHWQKRVCIGKKVLWWAGAIAVWLKKCCGGPVHCSVVEKQGTVVSAQT